MWDVFKKDYFMANRDVVDQHKVLMDLSHVPNVGDDRNFVSARQQTDSQEFADSAETCAIGLQKANASCLEVVLENYAIRNVLADREQNRRNLDGKFAMRINIVRVGRFLDPPRMNA